MTEACIQSIHYCFILIGVRVENDYGMLGIEDYLVVVWVCCMKYACGVVLHAWLCYVFCGDTQQGFGCDPEYVVLETIVQNISHYVALSAIAVEAVTLF